MNEQITTDQFGEQLSCLMDGELPRDQLRFLLRRIDADTELVQRWSRYQLVRGSLRRQATLPLRADFTEILMRRLAQEAAPLANRRGAALLRWAGGGAIAAAVAVVALVATRPPGENPSSSIATTMATLPAAPMVTPQDGRFPSSTLPPMLANFDYAQPASFDSGVVPIPRYDTRHRYEAAGAGTANGFGPYVLLTAPRSQQAAPSGSEVPQP